MAGRGSSCAHARRAHAHTNDYVLEPIDIALAPVKVHLATFLPSVSQACSGTSASSAVDVPAHHLLSRRLIFVSG
jgi:hypothetical protein